MSDQAKVKVDTYPELDEHGHEVPDPRPMRIPAGFKRPETLAEQVQRLVRTHVSRLAEAQGAETFEESEDFDVGDDEDPSTPYETHFDPLIGKDLSAAEFKQHEAHYRMVMVKKTAEAFANEDRAAALRERRPPPGKGEATPPAPAPKAPESASPTKP